MKKYLSKSFVFLVVLAFILSSLPQDSFIAWAMPDDTPQNTATVSPTETPAPTLAPSPAPSDNSTPSPVATASPADTIVPTVSPDDISMPTGTIAPSSSPAPVSDGGTTVNSQGLVLPACVPTDDGKYDLHVKELPQLENEYTIAYQNSDGTNSLYYYQLPVKYKDKNGKYQYIDNSLVSVTDSKNSAKGFKYQNKSNNNLNILFPDDLVSDKSIRLEKGNFYFEMKPDTDIRSNTDKLSGKLFKAAGQYQGQVKSDKIDNRNLDTVDYSKSMGNDVDLEYSTTWGGLKENIILNKYTGQNTFSFIIHTNGNPVMQPDYAMLVNDKKTGQCLAFMNNFSAVDSFSGDRVEGDGHDTQNITANIMPVDGQANTYRLSIAVDQSFLTNPDTVYPVIIDPSCTISSDEDAFEDTQVSNLYAQNYAAYQDLRFGYWGSYHVVRVFTQFNLSKILGQHPGTITSAYYHAYCPDPYNSNAIAQVYRVAASWTTAGTNYLRWSNQPGLSDLISQKLINGTTHKYWDLDITQLVTNWLKNTWPNYGFCIRMQDESSSSGYTREFYSAEMSTYPPEIDITFTQDFTPPTPTITSPANSIIAAGTVPIQGTVVDDAAGLGISSWQLKYALGPAMTGGTLIASGTSAVPSVTTLGNLDTSSFAAGSLYTVWLTATDIAGNTNTTSIQIIKDNTSKVGMKSYWTYEGFNTGSGTGNVNVASGNLVYQSTDFSFPSLIPMTMTRTYNSQSMIGSSLGGYWNNSFDIRLYSALDGSQIILKEGDGTLEHFTYSNGVYTPEAGLFEKLEKLGDNTWKLTKHDNTVYLFNVNMSLNKIVDLNGNYLQYAYNSDGTINTVTSSASEVVTFSYYTSTDNNGIWTGLLKSVTDPAGRVFNYTYNNAAQLISRSFALTGSTNWTEQFAYNTSGLLSGITDGNGNQTTLLYNTGKVSTITYPVTTPTQYIQSIGIAYNGNQTTVTSQYGQGTVTAYSHTTYTFDSIYGYVSKITDALNHDTNYTYDTSKLVVTGKSYHNNTINGVDTLVTWSYEYDNGNPYNNSNPCNNGNLTKTTDPLGYLTIDAYNSLNEITSETIRKTSNTADDAITTYTYSTDGKGNLLTITDPKNHTTTYTYYGNGQTHTVTDYANHTTTYSYNSHDWLIETDDPEGNVTKTLSAWYDGMGNPLYEEDQNGDISKNVYDTLERVITAYQATSDFNESNCSTGDWSSEPHTSTVYDLNGNTTASISADGIETDNSYDQLNRQHTSTIHYKNPDNSDNPKTTTTDYSYDSNHNYMVKITDSDGNVNETIYDSLNRVTHSITDPNGKDSDTAYTFDQVGNTLTQITTDKDLSANPVVTVTVSETDNIYDVENRVTQTTLTEVQNVHTTSYGYDSIQIENGIDYFVDTVTDENGLKATWDDKAGNLYKEIDTLTAGTTFSFSYDTSTGSVTNIKVGTTNPRTLEQDTYDTTSINNLVQTTYGNGELKHFTYDAQGRVTHERFDSDSSDRFDFGYDDDTTGSNTGTGSLNDIVDHARNVETKYLFTSDGKLSEVKEGAIGFSTPTHDYQITYDDNDNIQSVSEANNGQSNTISFGYNDDNKLTSANFSYGANNTSKTTWAYDDYNRINEQDVYDNNTTNIFNTMISYTEAANSSNYVQTIENKRIGQSGYDKILTYGYDNDTNHNITTVSDGTNITRYTYNEYKQWLLREDNQAAGKTWTWTYDLDGNITSKNEYNYTTGNLGTPNSTVTYTYDDSRGWADLLTSYNGVPISYDESGNPTYDGTWAYTWEAGRNLVGLSKTGTNVAYVYNSDGIRASKTVNGVTTNYTLVNGIVTQETDGTNTICYRYDANDNFISMNLNGTEYYYIKDAQGDIIGLFDRTGAVVVEYSYDAWGNILSTTGSLANTVGAENPYRYRGYRFDNETGWYYLQSRYYNPVWGRFINRDDIRSSAYIFSYCKNNPINSDDPHGQYNRSLAVKYVQDHDDWNKINLDYRPFLRDNCANTISQALFAGGIMMTPGWHSYSYLKLVVGYNPGGVFSWPTLIYDIAPSWRLVYPQLEVFKSSRYSTGRINIFSDDDIRKAAESGKVHIGDLVYMDCGHFSGLANDSDMSHAAMISKVTSDDLFYTGYGNGKYRQLEYYYDIYLPSRKKTKGAIIIIKMRDNCY